MNNHPKIALTLLAVLMVTSARPSTDSNPKQLELINSVIPSLLPGLFPNQYQVKNPLFEQITPLVKPASNILQPFIDPLLKPLSQNTQDIPIVGNVFKDCTKNFLVCLFNTVDNAIQN